MAMANVKLICKACGNEFTWRRECHSRRDADSSEAWARANITLCPKCAAKARREAEAAELAEAVKALPVELPDNLTGSEKQIAWAKDIRAKYVVMLAKGCWASEPQEILPYHYKVMDMLLAEHPEAKWWIDHLEELGSGHEGRRIYGECLRRWNEAYKVTDPEDHARMMEILNDLDAKAKAASTETPAEEHAEETDQPEALEEGDRPMKHYSVHYTEFDRPDISSPIDTIEAPEGYTAEQYVEDCMRNADEAWCEMLRKGWVELYDLDHLWD